MPWYNDDGGSRIRWNMLPNMLPWVQQYQPPGYDPMYDTNLQWMQTPDGWGWGWQPWAGEPGGPVLDRLDYYPASQLRRGRKRSFGEWAARQGQGRDAYKNKWKQRWATQYGLGADQQQDIVPMPEPTPPEKPVPYPQPTMNIQPAPVNTADQWYGYDDLAETPYMGGPGGKKGWW